MKYFALRYFTVIVLLSLASHPEAQKLIPFSPVNGETLPPWAIEMYSDNPNIWRVDDGYRRWRQSNPDAKTTYTQYYKKWRRELAPFINHEGFEQHPTDAEKLEFKQRLQSIKAKSNIDQRNFSWSVVGPFETFNTNTGPSPLAKSSQVNVYCFDQSLSHPDILYCGTEGGEVYKSLDKGENWFCVSRQLVINAPGAIEIHPTNPDIVLMGENNRLQRTIDGGQTWEVIAADDNMYVNDIKFNPAYPDTIVAATENGLYRTTNGGDDWTQVLMFRSYDVEWKTDDPSIAFLVRNDPIGGVCNFYKSTDYGATWERKEQGWFFSDLPGRNDGGARLAVTNADANRVYAVLIGEAKSGDDGFIGIYRSDDAGETWTLPNPPAGGPYDDNVHPNMATIGRTGGYHQGFYNLGFDASDSNPDALLVGFLSLWYSIDGATTWTCFGGYCGNAFNYVHPDCQEIEINGDDVWMTSDGGIEYSDDFFETHYARNRGITGSDYWGFGQGWNEDIIVGGRYHNGNSGWHENWMPGEYLSLGGGEAATGYVSPGAGRKTYFSDIGGVVLPESQNGYASYFNLGKYPNESYYDAESGEMEFSPLSWNTIYVTNENKIWRTTDGGSSWHVLHEFGKDVNARTMGFEISRDNPLVMYLFQRDEYSWDPGLLWKTIDGGETWEMLPLPTGYARRALLALDPMNANKVWLAYPDGNDGEKIYKSIDGGMSWENLTTSNLNGEHITYVLYQGGYGGGVYLGTYRTVWWQGDYLGNDWLPYNEGLPASIATDILRPFYRDNKIRMAAYGKGIWEAPFFTSSDPVPQPMANKLETACPGDTIQFDDYSMVDAQVITRRSWHFEGGTPSESDERNPKVVYDQPGEYNVFMSILYNDDILTLKTVNNMIRVLEPVINSIPPQIDFNTDSLFTINNPDAGITWTPTVLEECNASGDIAYFVDNYTYSSYGQDELVLPINMDLTKAIDPKLKFRVAYAPYFDGNAFIDSLHVLLSYNCGQTYDYIFRSGGEALSTTTSGQGPNNLYEYEVFTPQNCEEWRHVTIDLSSYEGKYVTIKFLNKSGYGNQMYLDDIFLESNSVGATDVTTANAIEINPNPTSGIFTVSSKDATAGISSVTITNSIGEQLFARTSNGSVSLPITFSLVDQAPGVYIISVVFRDGNVMLKKLVKE